LASGARAGPSVRMNRIIRLLALSFVGLTVGWPQSPPVDLQRQIASRYLDWSQSNTVLVEAARRLTPCSPRLSSLLVEVRDNATALAAANRQYFNTYGAAARKEIAEVLPLTSDAETAVKELEPLEALDRQYRQRLASKRDRAGAEPLGNLAVAGEGALDSSGAVRIAGELRNGLAQQQTLLLEITAGVEAEQKLWTAYYDAFEAAMRTQCRESQVRSAKPPVAAPVKR
jgi:hypothetical protein